MSLNISIVMPSFNKGAHVEATIRSVLDQKYPHLEYIVMDGGSTDGTLDTLEHYANAFSYWTSGPDKGQYDAVNKGFARASGDIFAWINADDRYFPWTFRTASSVFEQCPEVEWLSTLAPAYLGSDGQMLAVGRPYPSYSREAFLDGRHLPACGAGMGLKFMTPYGCIQQESTFWRRSLWEKAGGLRLEFDPASDFDLWSRFYDHTELFGIRVPLAAFRHTRDNRHQARFDDYTDRSVESLNEMRVRHGWKLNPVRYYSHWLGESRLSIRLSALLGKRFQYRCHEVEGRLEADATVGWHVAVKRTYV